MITVIAWDLFSVSCFLMITLLFLHYYEVKSGHPGNYEVREHSCGVVNNYAKSISFFPKAIIYVTKKPRKNIWSKVYLTTERLLKSILIGCLLANNKDCTYSSAFSFNCKDATVSVFVCWCAWIIWDQLSDCHVVEPFTRNSVCLSCVMYKYTHYIYTRTHTIAEI